MKLKEAQMLGVLALIAVGIILLCMWGGNSPSEAPAPDAEQAQAAQSPALEPDLAELYNELLGAPAGGNDASTSRDGAASMAVGGRTPAQPAGGGEEAALRSMIERATPAQIPLAQTPKEAPQTAPATAPAAQAPRTITHVVRSGETLSAISQKYYGTTANWGIILKANSSVVKDPKDLRPDMKLVIPAVSGSTASAPSQPAEQRSVLSATAPAAPSTARTHVVAKGDTLFRIALKYYGDGNRYRDVLTANRTLVSSPQDLRPGMKLVIP